MKISSRFGRIWFLLVFSYSLSIPLYLQAQDRRISENIVFPDNAFYKNGGRIINVKDAPFNAKGDGVTDDTEALIAAYDLVAQIVQDLESWQDDGVPLIYMPNGTYLVSNTIIYSIPRITYSTNSHGGISKVRWIGQDREKTIIKLIDNAVGFNSSPKPVLAFHKDHGTNIPGANVLKNITIHSGSGNPSAIGVLFTAANTGMISNVDIISGDGQGSSGLLFGNFSAQGYYSNITIEGFDYGIRNEVREANNPACEYITLKNQKIAGIYNEAGATHLRCINSINNVPFIKTLAGSVIVLESSASQGSSEESAIVVNNPAALLFARDIKVEGYNASVTLGTNVVATGNIDEFVSLKDTFLFSSPRKSMNLPVATPPIITPIDDFSDWACVDDYPGKDDSEKLTNALNSGKPVIYFTKSKYEISGTFEIPATVRRIDTMFSMLPVTWSISENSETPLLIENCWKSSVTTGCERDIILRMGRGNFKNHNNSHAVLFVESWSGIGGDIAFCPVNQITYARGINNENKSVPCFNVNGGVLWCMGYKTEGWQASFKIHNSGICEALGGFRNQTGTDVGQPQVLVENGNVTHIGYGGMSGVYTQAVWETRDNLKREIPLSAMPNRIGGWSQNKYIPLYNGYIEDSVNQARNKLKTSVHIYNLATANIDIINNKTFIRSGENATDFNLMIYPNPAREYLYISFENPENNTLTFSIYNSKGNVVYKQMYLDHSGNKFKIPTKNFENGVYFIKMVFGKQIYSSNFISLK